MVQGCSQGDSNDVVCPLRPPHSSMQHTPSYLINWQNARLSFISYMLGRVLVTDTLSEQYIYIYTKLAVGTAELPTRRGVS